MPRKRNKFRAVKTTVNGVKYASKFEAKIAGELERYCDDNGWTLETQHPVKFACGAKAILDFVIRSASGTVIWYVEAKGRSLPVWNLKLRLIKHEHPDVYDHLTVVYARNDKGKLTPKWGGWVK
jgi:hypothetical protein